jgi:hypothetical protein
MSSSAPPAARVLRFDIYELDLLAGEVAFPDFSNNQRL